MKSRVREIDDILEYINWLKKQVRDYHQMEELLKIRKDLIKEKELLLKKL